MTGIQPELWVDRAGAAVAFYESAFGAWDGSSILSGTSGRSGPPPVPGRRSDTGLTPLLPWCVPWHDPIVRRSSHGCCLNSSLCQSRLRS